MRCLFIVSVVVAAAAFAEPTCKDRTKRLAELIVTFQSSNKSPEFSPARVPLFDVEKSLEAPAAKDWQRRGVRIVDRATATFTFADAKVLTGLAARASVLLCVETKRPLVQKTSLEATAAVVQPLIDKANSFDPADRATIITGELDEDDWGCKAMNAILPAMMKEKPGQRLSKLTKRVADALTSCKCPLKDGERAFAVVTLAADTWDDTETLDCAPLVVGAAPKAAPFRFPDGLAPQPTLGDLLAAVKAAGSAGLALPPAK